MQTARNLKIKKRKAPDSLFFQTMLCLPHSEHLRSFPIHPLNSLNQCSFLIIKMVLVGGDGVRQPKDNCKNAPQCALSHVPAHHSWKCLPSKPKPWVTQDSMPGDCNPRARADTHPEPNAKQRLTFPASAYQVPGNSKN